MCPGKSLPKPRAVTLRTLLDPAASQSHEAVVLDSESIVLYFPAPTSVTGEDVLELHVHGGPATVKAVLAALARCRLASRVRYAEPGEFTKRAFVNARLDLAQVESLSDILSAETEQQRRASVRGSSGTLGRTYERWRQQLLDARGEIEALIDFSEDQHFDESSTDLLESVTRQVGPLLRSIQLHEQGSHRSELLRNGIQVALLGPPNVGKSSLMNVLVGREASIVSGEAGTTRDIVEASLDIRGYLCFFADTAGFRSGPVEQASSGLRPPQLGDVELEGIRRAKRKALDSNVIVALASVEHGAGGPLIRYDDETLALAAQAQACLVVVNKRDAVDRHALGSLLESFKRDISARHPRLAASDPLTMSCKEAAASSPISEDPGGIHALTASLVRAFSALTYMPADQQTLLGVTERQRQLLVQCRLHLEDFMQEAQPQGGGREADAVLAAEHLRDAANCLARITGRGEAGDVEDVLGVVFEK